MRLADIAKKLIDIASLNPFTDIQGIDEDAFRDILYAINEKFPDLISTYESKSSFGTRRFILSRGIAHVTMEQPTSISEDIFRGMIVMKLDDMIDSLIKYISPCRGIIALGESTVREVLTLFCNWYWHEKDIGHPFNRTHPNSEGHDCFRRFYEEVYLQSTNINSLIDPDSKFDCIHCKACFRISDGHKCGEDNSLEALTFDLKEKLKRSIRAYELAINATPTGQTRNELTIERIEVETLLEELPTDGRISIGRYYLGFDFIDPHLLKIIITRLDTDGHLHVIETIERDLRGK